MLNQYLHFSLQILFLLDRVILFSVIVKVLVVILILLLCCLVKIQNYPTEERWI